MNSAWTETGADDFVKAHGSEQGDEIALLAYATRLVGSEPDLAMHGGGNTSLKGNVTTLAGDDLAALFVKASGAAMDAITPAGFVCLDLGYLIKLRILPFLSDAVMAAEFGMRRLMPSDSLPSIETLMHAFIARRAVIHTHPTAILALTNRAGGEATVVEALGSAVGVIPYSGSGLALGRLAADLHDQRKELRAIVAMHHGLITWGASLKEAYDETIETVNRAEDYLRKCRSPLFVSSIAADTERARRRYAYIAPIIRGLVSPPSGDRDNPYRKMILVPGISEEILALLGSPGAERLFSTAPLTPDYLVRTKSSPLFVERPAYDDRDLLRRQLAEHIGAYGTRYESYVTRCASRLPGFDPAGFDFLPRVLLLPGLGAVCAGPDIRSAQIARDITAQALAVKRAIHDTGGSYEGPAEEHLFDMEFRPFQQAKIAAQGAQPLRGGVAIVTGAAGAIGSAVSEELLARGCSVAVTDLAGDALDAAAVALKGLYGERVLGAPLDVTDAASVAAAFEKTIAAFGGVDIVVINAGLAHVSPLTEMDLDAFKKLEAVNVEGTLLMLAQAGEIFRMQNMAGDIVLVSTKNVFAPGARFGAYSATKAAAHQLCRIASLEFADMGVRVNMVSPDAVFSHGARKSGLWLQVGPDRMRARGLDEKGLEEFYRQRNLLKSRVTAAHVARAVTFFVTHQTPTTGATIPVDGGLPDATPR